MPVLLRGADARVAEDAAKDVAFARGERAVVGQHGGGGAVPGDDLPGGGLDQGGAGVQRVEQALQAGRDAFRGLVADLGRTAEAEHEKVLALDLGQHQPRGDAVQHVRRGSAAAPLLQPRVPRRADVGALGHLFPTQPGRPPAPREPEGGGIEPGAPILEVGPQRVGYVHGPADPVGP